MQKSIAIVGQKGGTGKSTLACNLAVIASGNGKQNKRVALVDTDDQGTTATWGARRVAEIPMVMRARWDDVADVLADLADYDYVFIDTQGHASGRTTKILGSVNLGICPIRPTWADLETAEQTAAMVKAAGAAAMFVLNQCGPRILTIPQREVLEARPYLAAMLPLCDVEITDRRSIARAYVTGQAVSETDPESKGDREIAALWASIEKRLHAGS